MIDIEGKTSIWYDFAITMAYSSGEESEVVVMDVVSSFCISEMSHRDRYRAVGATQPGKIYPHESKY